MLISLIVAHVLDDDEEIAAQALKCLGFMIYYHSIAATLRVDDVSLFLESLSKDSKLIRTTKLKSSRNLGAWRISVQQLRATFLAIHFHSLLWAIVHAQDSPLGSLSTTFEATEIQVSVFRSIPGIFILFEAKKTASIKLISSIKGRRRHCNF